MSSYQSFTQSGVCVSLLCRYLCKTLLSAEAGQSESEIIREALATGDRLAKSQQANSPNQHRLPGLYAANIDTKLLPTYKLPGTSGSNK